MTARYRLAVVMFTDIVGSTVQRQRLGNDRAEELRMTLDRLQLDVVTSHHGEFVKHTGDGIMATFDSATNAVNAAITLQTELQRAAPRLSEATELRVGVAAGDVTSEYGDLFGMAPIIAARLCAKAEASTVLVDDLTRQLVAGETELPFDECTPLDLKGVTEPVMTWVLRPVADQSPVPLPGPLRGDNRFLFVGRDDEFADLQTWWRRAKNGERQVVVVSGEAGVGKTRLVAQLAAHVQTGGGTVLYGRNDPDLVAPYQPFTEAIREFVSQLPTSLAASRLGPSAAHLVRLVPDLQPLLGDPPPSSGDAETERIQLFDAVAGWLSAASSSAPLLLVLDDMHWAAEPTLQMLRYVARSTLPMSVMITGTSRDSTPDGMSADHLLAKLGGSDVQELRLAGFDDSTTLAFIEAAARHPFGEDGLALAALVCEQTAGNALFTRELLLHLIETGLLAQVDGRWSTTTDLIRVGIPDGIRRVVTERLGRLSTDAQVTMAWASAIGEVFDGRLMAGARGTSTEQLLDSLQECCRSRLLVEEAAHRYRFTHGLVRSSLYQSLGHTRRVTFHLRIAEALERLVGDDPMQRITELAYHATQGAAEGFHLQAVRYNTLAGDGAMAQFAASDAAVFYRTALEVLDASPVIDPALRCDLLTSLGRALMQSGDPSFADALDRAAEAARALDDAERLGAVVLAASRGAATASGAVDGARVEMIEATLELLGPGDSALRARLLGVLAAELHFGGVTQRVISLADEAVHMARRVDDPATVAFALVQRAAALRSTDHLARRRADLRELVELSRALGDPITEVITAQRLAEIAFESARYDELLAALERSESALASMGAASRSHLQLRVMRNRAELAMLRGEVDSSVSILEQMMELADQLGLTRQAVAGYMGSITKARTAQGRAAETIPLWRQLSSDFGATFLAGLGTVLLDSGQVDEAERIYRSFADEAFTNVTPNLTWLHNLAFLTVLCRRFGTADEAATLESLLSPHADLMAYAGAGCYGSIAHFLGLLAAMQHDLERADWWYDRAVQINASMHAPLLQATTLVARAELLEARQHGSDPSRALQLREEAVALAVECGAPAIVAAARAGTGSASSAQR